ncbi:circadian clock-controlled protein daywake-like [Pararge aegeria]|uniref:circadian clock-controlled protein daywake-like n=1 Tax=Pararge aegeria TaxID=116150 RepID=UPI0019D1EAD3|nr:circadian clock-controlled protein daywake-like [Pararge aegeria]
MTAVTYSLFVLMQLSLIYGSPVIIPYKCLLWDSSCLTASAQAAVRSFTSGIPELGIERLDTMFIDGLHIDQDGYKADWNNIYLQGMRNTIVDKLSIDMNSKVLRLLFHTNLSLKAHYVKQGYLLSLPVSGDGEVAMQMQNVHMEFVIPFEIIKNVKGRDIMDLKGYQYWYDIKDGVDVHFGNLYYGNNELSRKMHTLIQQNWKLLTVKYGRYLFDKSNDKIFNAIRNYMHSRPLDTVTLY